MNNQVLTGTNARKALRSQKTKDKCGYFMMTRWDHIIRWFVWCHREKELRGIQLDSEEACKRWLL